MNTGSLTIKMLVMCILVMKMKIANEFNMYNPRTSHHKDTVEQTMD